MIYILATLDTKAPEALLLRDRLRELDLDASLIDTGCLGEPGFAAEVTREQVFAAGGSSLEEQIARNDRGAAVALAARGAAAIVRQAFERGECEGLLGLGGSAGTTIGCQAMRGLPLGLPKLMVSTLASGQVRQWVGESDIMLLNSVVDIAGINRISRMVLMNAAAAMAGMVRHRAAPSRADKPLIAATMFGVTTACVMRAKEVLEAAGYEVLVFHATGNGGRAMESLIDQGQLAGVLDLTTTELADELVGGILSAGPDRLTAAARRGIPQVVSVGATDMVNFGPRESVPERFADRLFYQHNATVTLMRTTPEECAAIGRDIRDKLSRSRGLVVIVLPGQGVSAIDRTGQSFDDPQARLALFEQVRETASAEIVELDCHINDPLFAETAAAKLLELIKAVRKG